MGARKRVVKFTSTKMVDALDEWIATMQSKVAVGLMSMSTIKTYTYGVKGFIGWAEDHDVSSVMNDVTVRNLNDYLAHIAQSKSTGTAKTQWAGLLAFWKWAHQEKFIDVDVMVDVNKPDHKARVIPGIPDHDIKAMLSTCETDSFKGVRDVAIMRLLLSTGMRRQELATITMDNLHMREGWLLVTGKGGYQRTPSITNETARALRTYLRYRSQHPHANSPYLFIGNMGPLSGNGVEHMLRRRAIKANVHGVNAHAWRHTWAGQWMEKGGSEIGLMAQGGWRTRSMIDRYTAHNRDRNAMAEARTLDIGGNI